MKWAEEQWSSVLESKKDQIRHTLDKARLVAETELKMLTEFEDWLKQSKGGS